MTSRRLAFGLFAAVEVAALVIFGSHASSGWFALDEWNFIVDRSAFSPHDLFDDFNGHWVTLPIIAYRLLWALFGIRSYVPYLALVLLLHLAAAALLRVVMRRSGVNPWVATAAASLFALFGTGHQNIIWAFQIQFTGALVLGLVHLLLADHDGSVDRRDWIGLGCGLGAVMCSGVGVTTVAVVALAALIRRGWGPALFHALTLGAVFLGWWIAIGRHGFAEGRAHGDASLEGLARFVQVGVSQTFQSLGQSTGMGIVLGTLSIAGLILAWKRFTPSVRRRQLAAPAALAAGAVAFLVESGYSRVGFFGPDIARSSRYQHVVAALMLPALALALGELARRWWILVPTVCALLMIGIPGNVQELIDMTHRDETAHSQGRHLISAIPLTATGAAAVRGVHPTTSRPYAPEITVGWLRDAAEAGKLPDPGRITAEDRAEIRFRLSLLQAAGESPPVDCAPLTEPITVDLAEGDRFWFFEGALRVTAADGAGGSPRLRVDIPPILGDQLTALRDIRLVISRKNPFVAVRVCGLVAR